jgi:hypothetical protein
MIAGAVAAVCVALLAVGAVLAANDRHHRERREAAARGRTVTALRARLTRIQAPHRGAAPALKPPAGASRAERLRARAALVSAVEVAITRDARARARAGELDGPIIRTACGTIAQDRRAVPDDRVLSRRIGRYDCIAIQKDVAGATGTAVGELGHPFVAALNFDRFTYTWCRNTPAQSERGVPLVFVRLDRACLAATGPALGTGYADVPTP